MLRRASSNQSQPGATRDAHVRDKPLGRLLVLLHVFGDGLIPHHRAGPAGTNVPVHLLHEPRELLQGQPSLAPALPIHLVASNVDHAIRKGREHLPRGQR